MKEKELLETMKSVWSKDDYCAALEELQGTTNSYATQALSAANSVATWLNNNPNAPQDDKDFGNDLKSDFEGINSKLQDLYVLVSQCFDNDPDCGLP